MGQTQEAGMCGNIAMEIEAKASISDGALAGREIMGCGDKG